LLAFKDSYGRGKVLTLWGEVVYYNGKKVALRHNSKRVEPHGRADIPMTCKVMLHEFVDSNQPGARCGTHHRRRDGGVCLRSILEANAQREVFSEAGLMMDSALAIRNYTANEILPLLSGRMENDFPPQSVPFYAATQNFLQLRARHPEYMYKEATLNPTNPRDRAADWEADIIQRFRSDTRAPGAVRISAPVPARNAA
jgi:Protein of unknown function (DUF3365)